jgi:hypothetical protein
VNSKFKIINSKFLNSRPSAADVRADILTQLLGVVNRIEVAEGGDGGVGQFGGFDLNVVNPG